VEQVYFDGLQEMRRKHIKGMPCVCT
jgi:hypothetical protein